MGFSELDFQNMEARVNRGRKTPVAPDAEANESDLHNKIIRFCKERNWIYFRGSMAHKAMRVLGEPDFTILASHGRVFFVECKSKTGKLSPEQMGIQLAASILGHTVHAVRSLREFTEIVQKEFPK